MCSTEAALETERFRHLDGLFCGQTFVPLHLRLDHICSGIFLGEKLGQTLLATLARLHFALGHLVVMFFLRGDKGHSRAGDGITQGKAKAKR